MSAKLQVSIVTFNSGPYLRACIQSLKTQTYQDFSVFLWDNASTDDTPAILANYQDTLSFVHYSEDNVGFCAAHNRLISSAASDYVLVLNPDVVLEERFLDNLIRGIEEDPSAGSATGKLLRWQTGKTLDPELIPALWNSPAKVLDSTGIYLTPNQRHFDRGSNEIDSGQYEKREYVFGASGAAALYRRAMLRDIQDGDQIFDESFFAYREDVDLAWRAQWMGWRCLYLPDARAFHVRKVLPERRPALPAIINRHTFKNRFLLRVKNMDFGTYARYFVPITLRDIGVAVYVLTREWSSLSGIPLIVRAFPHAWAQRKYLQQHRRVSVREMRSWFSYRPVAKRISGEAGPVA
jgi:GT2 family glycosyltransferase